MRRFTIIVYVAIIFFGCGGKNPRNPEDVAITATNIAKEKTIVDVDKAYFKLTNNRFDFGEIKRKKSPDIPIEVEFTNVGNAPLLILKADVSCGCISVDYPKKPTQPDQKNIITIHIDSQHQEGFFNKTVFFKTNAENDVELVRIVGNVRK